MIGYQKYWLFLTAILNIISSSVTDYIYQTLNGNLADRNQFNFSLFVRHLNGTIFYGVDSHNKFLMEFKEEFDEMKMFIIFNNHMASRRIENLCNCSECSNIYLTFRLHLNQSQIEIICGQERHQLIIDKLAPPDRFQGYPKPDYNFHKNINKIFVWMANIGPYRGYDNSFSYLLPRQLKGCLDGFYFRDKIINMNLYNEKKDLFLPSCDIKTKEKTCAGNHCTVNEISIKMYDCSLQIMNGRYCPRAFKVYIGHKSFVRNTKTEKSGRIRLDWILPHNISDGNYCLMELQMKDGSLVIFYLNQYNIIIMNTRMNSSNEYKNLIKLKTERGINNIISMDYNESFFVTRIYNGTDIVTDVSRFSEEIDLINIGFCQHINLFSEFEGMIDLHYNKKQFRKKTNGHTTTKPNLNTNLAKIYPLIISAIIISIFVLAVVVIIAHKSGHKIKRRLNRIKGLLTKCQSADNNTTVMEEVYTVYSSPRRDSIYLTVSD